MKNLAYIALLATLLVSASAQMAVASAGMNFASQRGSMVTIKVNAYDKLDPYVRDWNLFIDKIPGAYLGGGVFANSTPSYVAYARSGSTATYRIYLTPGTHTVYLVIGQSGGDAYGVYNGTMTVNTQKYAFSGLTVNNYFAANITVK